MKWTIAVVLCFCAVVAGIFQSPEPRGIQLRITQKGLDYSEYHLVYLGLDFARYCIQTSLFALSLAYPDRKLIDV